MGSWKVVSTNLFQIEKGEGDNFAISNRFLEKSLFSKELFETFAN
jgi:hypothetical protein